MAEPWLTIIGIGEDGPDGLSRASREAIARADVVAGAARHLALLPGVGARGWEWPVPFAEGIAPVLAMRGRAVVVLASGDPFWFGAGAVLAARLDPGEWVAHPGPSCFGLAAARLGWRLEEVVCLGLHAAPLTRMRPHLAQGMRILVTLRDGAAVSELAGLLTGLGFGRSTLWCLEALGGPRERIGAAVADAWDLPEAGLPVMAAVEVSGTGDSLPVVAGRADGFFEHDGQITKRPVRALTLSALAPKPGELLWDIGAGSGSIAIEWLLAHPSLKAIAIEEDPERGARLLRNAATLGVDRLMLQLGSAPEALAGVPDPGAVFVGGGADAALLEFLWARLQPGVRLVVNAVTLETEALLAHWHLAQGGGLMRIELAEAQPLGQRHGWRSAMPIVQWSVVR